MTALDVIGWSANGVGSLPVSIVSTSKGATGAPEPASLALLGIGMAAMSGVRRRRS